MSERTRTVLIAVVTTVWAANFAAGMFIKGYETSESINGIFMAIVGGVFALGARREDPPAPPPAEEEAKD